MLAIALLNELVSLQNDGVDLSKLTVEVQYTAIDPSIPFDMGTLETYYPDEVLVVGNSLLLKP